jgi:hypothetical protein
MRGHHTPALRRWSAETESIRSPSSAWSQSVGAGDTSGSCSVIVRSDCSNRSVRVRRSAASATFCSSTRRDVLLLNKIGHAATSPQIASRPVRHARDGHYTRWRRILELQDDAEFHPATRARAVAGLADDHEIRRVGGISPRCPSNIGALEPCHCLSEPIRALVKASGRVTVVTGRDMGLCAKRRVRPTCRACGRHVDPIERAHEINSLPSHVRFDRRQQRDGYLCC